MEDAYSTVWDTSTYDRWTSPTWHNRVYCKLWKAMCPWDDGLQEQLHLTKKSGRMWKCLPDRTQHKDMANQPECTTQDMETMTLEQ